MNMRTKSKWIHLAIIMALALLGVLLLVLPMRAAFAAQDGTDGGTGFSADVVTATTTANLNIRSEPGLEYEILATLPEGSVVGFTGFTDGTGDWVQVDAADGPLGWVVARYLSNVPEGLQVRPADVPEVAEAEAAPVPLEEEEAAVSFSPAVVTATASFNLNVRSDPGTEHELLDTIPAGSVVGFTGFMDGTGEWIQVDAAAGPLGWVAAQYLSSVPEGLQIQPADVVEVEAAPAPVEEEEAAVTFSPAVVTATASFNLNIRSGPGTEYELLVTLQAGSVVGFTGFMDSTGNWVQVDAAAGPTGWVAGQYLSNVPGDLQVWEGES